MRDDLEVKHARQLVVRISKGRFAPEVYADVKKQIDESAMVLVPAIQALTGLLYYRAGVDENTASL
jgi:DNA integrity scanning protein DisA with diadenylate cyclase activity